MRSRRLLSCATTPLLHPPSFDGGIPRENFCAPVHSRPWPSFQNLKMSARTLISSSRFLCKRCFQRFQPLIAAKRFRSKDGNSNFTGTKPNELDLWEIHRKTKALIQGKFFYDQTDWVTDHWQALLTYDQALAFKTILQKNTCALKTLRVVAFI